MASFDLYLETFIEVSGIPLMTFTIYLAVAFAVAIFADVYSGTAFRSAINTHYRRLPYSPIALEFVLASILLLILRREADVGLDGVIIWSRYVVLGSSAFTIIVIIIMLFCEFVFGAVDSRGEIHGSFPVVRMRGLVGVFLVAFILCFLAAMLSPAGVT